MKQARKSKPIGRQLLVVWILFLYIFAGYYALYGQNQSLTGDSAQALIDKAYKGA